MSVLHLNSFELSPEYNYANTFRKNTKLVLTLANGSFFNKIFILFHKIEGYKYSKEEIEAYQVPYRIKSGPCVDTFIPLKKCFHDKPVGTAAMMLDSRYPTIIIHESESII